MMLLYLFILAEEASVRQQLIGLVNQDRRIRGLQPVCDVGSLDNAADRHSVEMAMAGRIYHENGANTPWSRMRAFTGFSRSENILKTPVHTQNDAALAKHLYMLWKTSPEHWKNIVDAKVNKMGFAIHRGADSFTYATQNFGIGGERCNSPPAYGASTRIYNKIANPIRNAFNWLTGKKSAEEKEKEAFIAKKRHDEQLTQIRRERESFLKRLFAKKKDDAEKQAEEDAKEEQIAKEKKQEAIKVRKEKELEAQKKADFKETSKDSEPPLFGVADQLSKSSFKENGETDAVPPFDPQFANQLNKIEEEMEKLGKPKQTSKVEKDPVPKPNKNFDSFLSVIAKDMEALDKQEQKTFNAVTPIPLDNTTSIEPLTADYQPLVKSSDPLIDM